MKQLIQNMRSGSILVKDVPVPRPGKGFALVKTAFSLVSAGTERTTSEFAEKNLAAKAIARPDLVKQVVEKTKREGLVPTLESAFNRLDQPMFPGYSSAGVIAAVGPGLKGFSVGDRVACGGGSYAVHAEYELVPKNLLVKLPDTVSDEAAAFTTLGAVAMHGFRLSEARLDESVLVIGLGLLGLLTIQIAKAAGCVTLGIDISEARIALGKELGSDACHNEAVKAKAAELVGARGFDHVLICAGSKENDLIALAGELCRDRGTVVSIGAVGLNIPRKIYYEKEIRFTVSRSYGPGRYDAAYEEKGQDYPIGYVRWTEGRNMESFVSLLARGAVRTDPLVSHRIPIEEGSRAYDLIKGKSGEPYLGVLLRYGPTTAELGAAEAIELRSDIAPGPVSVGVIGAGNYANATFLPMMRIDGAPLTLTSIASERGGSAREAGEKFGFSKIAVDADAVIQDPDVNAVVILTRHHAHSGLTVRALNAGKHVYCEKPLALTIDELRSVYLAAAQNPDQLLMVGYNRRFAPLAEKMKSFLSESGEPLAINYIVNAGFLPGNHWTQDPEIGGGRIIGEACHMIDFLTYLTGALPLSVQALALPNSGRYQDDNAVIQIALADGSFGTIQYLANGDRSYMKERIEVFSGGRIAILSDFRELDTWNAGETKKMKSAFRIDKGHSHSWNAFVDAVANGGQAPISLDEIFAASLASFAAVESIRQKDGIQVPAVESLSEISLNGVE